MAPEVRHNPVFGSPVGSFLPTPLALYFPHPKPRESGPPPEVLGTNGLCCPLYKTSQSHGAAPLLSLGREHSLPHHGQAQLLAKLPGDCALGSSLGEVG